jgi:hypothetical protein
VVIQVVVDNRFRPGFADVASPLATSVPCVIDVAGVPFEEVVAQAVRTTLNAYKLAYYSPVERAELEARIVRERGETVDLSCFFNDRRMSSRTEPPAGQPPSASAARGALPQSTCPGGGSGTCPATRASSALTTCPAPWFTSCTPTPATWHQPAWRPACAAWRPRCSTPRPRAAAIHEGDEADVIDDGSTLSIVPAEASRTPGQRLSARMRGRATTAMSTDELLGLLRRCPIRPAS